MQIYQRHQSHAFLIFVIALAMIAAGDSAFADAQNISLTSSSDAGVSITVNPAISGNVAIADGEVFLQLRGSDVVDLPGGVQEPVYLINVAIPQDANPSASVVAQQAGQIWHGRLAKTLESERETADDLPRNFSAGESNRGDGVLGKIQYSMIAGLRVMRIPVFPLRASHNPDILQLNQNIQINVKFYSGASKPANGKNTSAIHGHLSRLAEMTVINPDQARTFLHQQTADFTEYNWPQGFLYKFPVVFEGVYKITFEGLKTKGVSLPNAGLPSDRLRLFGSDGLPLPEAPSDSVAIGLRECPVYIEDGGDGLFEPGDWMAFYARGAGGWVAKGDSDWVYQTNPFATENTYWFNIDPAGGGLRMEAIAEASDPDTVVSAAPTRIYQETDRFIYGSDSFVGGGRFWYSYTFDGVSRMSSVVNLDSPDFSRPVDLRVRIVKSGTSYSNNPVMKLLLNNEEFTRFEIRSSSTSANGVTSFPLESDLLRSDANSLLFEQTRSGMRALFDWLDLEYTAQLNNARNFESIAVDQTVEYDFTDVSEPWVFDVTNHYNIRYKQGESLTMAENVHTLRRYSLLPGSGFKTLNAQFAEYFPPESDFPDLLNPANAAQSILIVPDVYYDLCERLKEHHTVFRDMRSARVRLSEIYNRFSMGVPDPAAIRNFLHYAVSEPWNTPPDFVTFCGDGDYNYRNIDRPELEGFLPTYQYKYDIKSSDDWFVDFNHSDGNQFLPEIAIGRLTAASSYELENMIDKIIAYDETPSFGPWRNRAVLVADDEFGQVTSTERQQVLDQEELANMILPYSMDKVKIYLMEYEREFGREKPKSGDDLVAAINEGALIVNYMGHGNPSLWAHEHVFVLSRDLPRILPSAQLPIYVAFTCDWAYWDNPSTVSFPEQLLALPERGAIATIASTRLTYENQNSRLAERFYMTLFHNVPEPTLAEALAISKHEAIISMGPTYHLMGDPTMFIGKPQLKGEFDSLTPYPLTPLATSTVSGRIINNSGRQLTNFDGSLYFNLYDVDVNKIHVIQGSETTYDLPYILPGVTIYRGNISVAEGAFSGNFVVPLDVSMGSDAEGKVVGYFHDERQDGVIVADSAAFARQASADLDNTPPEIEVYFGHRGYRNSDPISPEPLLIADVFDSSGLNLTGKMGHGISISIDGQDPIDLTGNFAYNSNSHQSGTLSQTIGPFEPGLHSAEIMAWDSFNNFALKTIELNIIATAGDIMVERVLNWPNPFKHSTSLTFIVNQPVDYEIKIFTVNGRKIWEHVGNMSRAGMVNDVEWDGRDFAGMQVGNGVYLYKVTVWDDEGNSASGLGRIARIR